MSNAIELISGDIYAVRDAFEACLVDRSINFDAEAGFALQILSANDFAIKIAQSNRQSVVDAVTNVAAIGLTLNPAKKLAYLVPRKGPGGKMAICLDVSYMGLIELAVASGAVMWAKADVVCQADSFKMRGMGNAPDHEFNPFGDRGDIVGVYCVAKLANGDYLTDVMGVGEVNSIRDRSEAWKSYQAGNIKSCPWATDWAEMAKKTVLKRGSKYWPKTDRLSRAIHYLNTDGGEGLEDIANQSSQQAQQQDQQSGAAYDVDAWIRKAQASKTEAELTKIYGEFMGMAAKIQDRVGAVKFKNAALGFRARLREELERNTIDMPADGGAPNQEYRQ